MAVIVGNQVSVSTFDQSYKIDQSSLTNFFKPDIERWEWLQNINLQEASEYYFTNFKSIINILSDAQNAVKAPPSIKINQYVTSNGDLGNFIFQTKHVHGNLIAYYALKIATTDPDEHDNFSFNKSEAVKKSTSYEYHLAHYLYFQYTNAAEYIIGNTKKSLTTVVDEFKKLATDSLERIERTEDSAHEILMATNHEHNRINTKLSKRYGRRVRRYRQVFDSVRKEAALAGEAARNDLKNAYNTYHAHVAYQAAATYWSEKIVEHNKLKWRWFCAVMFSLLLTFASPILYYALGGVSALSAWRHLPVELQASANASEKPETSLQSDKKEPQKITETSTIEKVAFASGIADLTGAALLVTLLSVLLRLCLRQYNVSIHLGQDAEERVTMLKTYLALSNEGKLTSDGDMKLVLDALFRASQTSGIPDPAPATPIELIIKAITEKK